MNRLFKILVTGLLLVGMSSIAFATEETIRPNDAWDNEAKTTNIANAYDANDATFSTTDWSGGIRAQACDDPLISFGQASGGGGADAWEAGNGSYDDAVFWVKYERQAASDNDTAGIYICDGTDTQVTTILTLGASAVAATWGSYTMTGGELTDPTDLRASSILVKTGGGDSGPQDIYIYDVKIVGNYTAGGAARRRMIIMQ